MKTTINRLISIVIGALIVVWAFGIYLFASSGETPLSCGGAITFGIIGAAIAIVYLNIFKHKEEKQATEVHAVSSYYTLIFVVVSLIMNTIFVIMKKGDFQGTLVFFNILIDVVYLGLLLFVENDVHRLSRQLEVTEQKISPSVNISAKLGELLSVAEDVEVKERLRKLKEMVDYSSNISVNATIDSERKMMEQLDEILLLLVNQKEKTVIQNKIRQAEITWKTHSSATSARRS